MFRSLTHCLADNPAQWHAGMAVVDLDGDGEFECVVAAVGGRNLVLKWGGDAFYDVALPPLTGNRSTALGVAGADVDGDGREELFLSDSLFAWRQSRWTDLLAGNPLRNQSTQSVLAYDRFGMGRYGFLIAHEGGPFRFLEVLSQDRVEDTAPLLGLARIAGGRSLIAAPLLDDTLQIYAGNEGIANMLFVRGPGDRYQDRAADCGLAGSTSAARGLAVIDANFDGRLDLICATRLGPQHLFLQGLQGSFGDIELEGPRDVRSVVVADFDNDGYEEIFLHGYREANLLYAWRDGAWLAQDCGEADRLGMGAVVADWNGDGLLELMLSHEGPLSLYSAQPNDNHWLRIAPLTAAGAPARGAIVRLHAAGRTHMRVIDGGSGYLCQNEPVAHFGLGRDPAVDWVEVIWPDQSRARSNQPAIRTTLAVPHPNQRL